eukprot:204416_1
MGNESSSKQPQRNDDLEESDDEIQELIVTGNDGREAVYEFNYKQNPVYSCIGQIRSEYTYDEHEYKLITIGTGTVFHVNTSSYQPKAYIISAVHNVKHTIAHCKGCDIYMERKQNKKRVKCKKCGKIPKYKVDYLNINATAISFKRRSNDVKTFGELIKRYDDCKVVKFDKLYHEYRAVTHGYDWVILSFIDNDNYYSKFCKNITFKPATDILQQCTEINIFGFPGDKQDQNKQFGLWGMKSKAIEKFKIKKNMKTGCKYLHQTAIDTYAGQSGAIIFCTESKLKVSNLNKTNKAIVFAIHVGGTYNNSKPFNAGTLINHNLLTELQYPEKLMSVRMQIVVSFGTDTAALAFVYKNKVTIYDKWKGPLGNSTSNATTRIKTKTQLILNDNNRATCFGNAAKFVYYNLEKEERKEKKFFEKFTKILYEDKIGSVQNITEAKDDEKKDDEKKYLVAANGQRVLAKTVFIAVFQQFQAKAKVFIPNNVTHEIIHDNEIQWIITIPAVFSQKAKNNLQKWITEAKYIQNHCVIVYEPDCASLSIRKQFVKEHVTGCNPVDDSENDNVIILDHEKVYRHASKYILIDAGRNTVDIACHKICNDGSVEEIVHPTGGKWGSGYIDELFVKLLEKIFGKPFMDNYKDKNPAKFVEVMEQFELAKKTFYKHKHLKE